MFPAFTYIKVVFLNVNIYIYIYIPLNADDGNDDDELVHYGSLM